VTQRKSARSITARLDELWAKFKNNEHYLHYYIVPLPNVKFTGFQDFETVRFINVAIEKNNNNTNNNKC